ncbi:MAG: hypothetical protein ACUVX1_08725 [Chloroflexota bacterium]
MSKLVVLVLLLLPLTAWASLGCAPQAAPLSAISTPTPPVATSEAGAPTATAVPTGIPTPRVSPEKPAATSTPMSSLAEGSAFPQAGAAAIPDEARRPVDLARADLADRLGISTDPMRVVSVEPREWPDASLGCPEPGKMYAQVVTPGFRVVLAVGERVYEYHTDRGETVVFCPNRLEPVPPWPKGVRDATPWQPIEPIVVQPTPGN